MSTIEEREDPKSDLPRPQDNLPIDQTSTLGPRSALEFNRQLVLMIVLAAFLTTFGQTSQLGIIPIQFLILKHMNLGAPDFAKFKTVSAAAWYFKPLAGLIIDSVPFLGTRRRSYMITASTLSIFAWIAVGYASATYTGLLLVALVLNLFMMIASTAMGALLVEYGQNKAATGGLSAARETVQNIGGVLIGFVGGWLAMKAFPLTGFVGASLMTILAVSAFFFLKEGRTATPDESVWRRAGEQLRTCFSSRQLWSAALMMLLIFLAPGFGSLLAQLQVKTLRLTSEQVGVLTSLSAAAAIVGGISYGFLCRFIDLRKLLVAGILLNVASTLIYFGYHNYQAALFIDPLNGLMGTLAVLPVYDLAARATPKGGEGMGFSVMMAVRNVALFGSDWAGAQAAQSFHIPFNTMLIANAGFTACVLILVPFIPAALVAKRDGAMPIPTNVKPVEAPSPSSE